MRLSDCFARGVYTVEKITLGSARKSRLNNLLICEKREIRVLFFGHGKCVVAAGGTIIGLSKSICENIEVSLKSADAEKNERKK